MSRSTSDGPVLRAVADMPSAFILSACPSKPSPHPILPPKPPSGRDVSNGTYRIDDVRRSFHRAARQLEALARGRSISDASINYLSVSGQGPPQVPGIKVAACGGCCFMCSE